MGLGGVGCYGVGCLAGLGCGLYRGNRMGCELGQRAAGPILVRLQSIHEDVDIWVNVHRDGAQLPHQLVWGFFNL